MGVLHKKRVLHTNEVGTLYECFFPEFIIRFTIYQDKYMRIKAFVWYNDHEQRGGVGRCMKELTEGLLKKPHQSVKVALANSRMRGSGYDTFEDMDNAWTKYYTEYLTKNPAN